MNKNTIARWLMVVAAALASSGLSAAAAEADKPAKPAAKPAKSQKPTLANVPYGPHPKQVLDFYKAESSTPTPLVFFIHGGGWMNGSKAPFNAANTSRPASPWFRSSIASSPRRPPMGSFRPSRDRSPTRPAPCSSSAAKRADGISTKSGSARRRFSRRVLQPVAGVSSRPCRPQERRPDRPRIDAALVCRGECRRETSLDPQQMKEWTPNSNYGGHAFGFKGDKEKKLSQFAEFLANRDKILPWIAEYSPYALVTSSAPPIYLFYSSPPALGQNQKDPTHTSNFGVKLQEKCKSVGVDCELVYPRART